MATESENWIGRLISGNRYRVMSKLGEGGMGLVYLARDRKLDTDVVIKVPRRMMLEDPEFVSRFKREIRSLVHLVHPHIVKVMDVGRRTGRRPDDRDERPRFPKPLTPPAPLAARQPPPQPPPATARRPPPAAVGCPGATRGVTRGSSRVSPGCT